MKRWTWGGDDDGRFGRWKFEVRNLIFELLIAVTVFWYLNFLKFKLSLKKFVTDFEILNLKNSLKIILS